MNVLYGRRSKIFYESEQAKVFATSARLILNMIVARAKDTMLDKMLSGTGCIRLAVWDWSWLFAS